MRLIKTFGLAAIAATVFSAFVGVASAAAELVGKEGLSEAVVCKAKEDPCAAANTLPSGTKIKASAVNLELLTNVSGAPIVCENGYVMGETTTSLAHGKITEMLWLYCKHESEGCSATWEHLPYLLKGELNSAHSAYITLVTSGGGGRPEAHVNCPAINCNYGSETITFEALLDETLHTTVLDVLQSLTGEGGICAFTSGVWHAKYVVHCLEGTTEIPCWLKMEHS